MSIDYEIFPTKIGYGSVGGPGWLTNIVQNAGGSEDRFPRWSVPRRRYDISYGIKSHVDIAEVHNFYMARAGGANGFLFLDYMDQNSTAVGLSTLIQGSVPITASDQEIGIGDAVTQQFQLIKKYQDSTQVRSRNIRFPTEGTVLVAFDGTPQASGFSVNRANGIVTFTTAPSLGVVITAGYEFFVPVRFSEATDKWFQWNLTDFGSSNAESIKLIELVDELEVPEDYNYGGGSALPLTEAYSLEFTDGRAISLASTIALD